MLPENVALTTAPRNPNRRRVRQPGHFRGWVPIPPARQAQYIAESVLLHRMAGNDTYHPEHYTSDAAVLALVKARLDREEV